MSIGNSKLVFVDDGVDWIFADLCAYPTRLRIFLLNYVNNYSGELQSFQIHVCSQKSTDKSAFNIHISFVLW